MVETVPKPVKWTKDALREEITALVQEHNIANRTQLAAHSRNLYQLALYYHPDILDTVFPRRGNLRWSPEKIRAVVAQEAPEIRNRAALAFYYPGAYSACMERYPALLTDLFGPSHKARRNVLPGVSPLVSDPDRTISPADAPTLPPSPRDLAAWQSAQERLARGETLAPPIDRRALMDNLDRCIAENERSGVAAFQRAQTAMEELGIL